MEGHTELWGLIHESQSGNKQATERLYTMFLPLLKKYAQKIGNEDALSDLTLSFLQMLKKMPIQDSDLASDDKYILSYISLSVKNAYIQINMNKEKYQNNNIFVLDDEEYMGECKQLNIEFITVSMMCGEMERLLSRNDYYIIIEKFINGRTEEDIANTFGISKQAINKRIKKIRRTLREVYK